MLPILLKKYDFLFHSQFWRDLLRIGNVQTAEVIRVQHARKDNDEKGNVNPEANPNGSINNIAGIFNKNKNILGMMPHPERMADKILSGEDGLSLFLSLMN